MTSFAHLHLHTEYSFLDGLGNVEDYAKTAYDMGFEYLGIADHGTIDGTIQFQKACERHNIIPIIGCELYMVPKLTKDRKRQHILVFVKNLKGFNNLCSMLTYANTKGFYYKPRVTHEVFLKHCDGLVVCSACLQSFATKENSTEFLERLIDKLEDDFYFEVMPHNTDKQVKHNRKIIRLAKKYDREIIATNDCHYVRKEDSMSQEILLAIQTKTTLNNPDRFKFPMDTLYLMNQKQLTRAFKKIEEYSQQYKLNRWFKNTVEIAEKCSDFRIKPKKVILPKYKELHNQHENDALALACYKGFSEIFKQALQANKKYFERYKYEFDIITEKNFARYFLIVKEFVDWCKASKFPIGPGRGSVGCSLIAYLLGITQIDPIYWNLPFERFYSRDRVDLPDIDIDIPHDKKEVAYQHLANKYGEEHISYISTFNKMKTRMAIKDVARVFEVDDFETNEFTKTIDRDLENGLDIALESEIGREYNRRYPQVIKYARKLDGTIRGRSQHAAGIIVSKRALNISSRGNLVYSKESKMINWEMKDAEYMGLMKLDILSLKMLSTIGECLEQIEKNKKETIDIYKLPLDNKKVLKSLNRTDKLSGIFQLTGYATKSLIEKIPIKNFTDIVAIIALSRPGPLESGMTEAYIERNNGTEWIKKHPIYERITSNTYGLLVYQEQVMAVISRIAGLPYTIADRVRKVIGKKRDPKEFEKYEKMFLDGCKKTEYFSKKEAYEFWEGLQKWARYGFNLAHSVEYSIVAYWSAFLKYYYPSEFFAALLTYAAKDKKERIIEEAYQKGMSLVLPMVEGKTDPTKWLSSGTKLYLPFTEIKGIADKTALTIKSDNKSISLFMGAETKGHNPSLSKKLDKANAYRAKENFELTEEVENMFEFRIQNNPSLQYKKIYEMFPILRIDDLDYLLEGNYKKISKYAKGKDIVEKLYFPLEERYKQRLSECNACELRKECTRPVPASIGKYNIAIVLEAPGVDEDEQNEVMVGKAGSLLWEYLEKYDLKKEMFFATNVNRCFPSVSRNPSHNEVDSCSYWTDYELKKVEPIVILACGGNPYYYFTGEEAGITRVSGTTIWNVEYQCWICYCVHPSSTFRNKENKTRFRKGIRNFYKTLEAINFYDML